MPMNDFQATQDRGWLFVFNAGYVVALVEAAGKQGKYGETLEALLAARDDWAMNRAVPPDGSGGMSKDSAWIWRSCGATRMHRKLPG